MGDETIVAGNPADGPCGAEAPEGISLAIQSEHQIRATVSPWTGSLAPAVPAWQVSHSPSNRKYGQGPKLRDASARPETGSSRSTGSVSR
jgi:hypothetical protein